MMFPILYLNQKNIYVAIIINLYQNENLSLLGNDSYLVINDQYDDEVYHEFFFSVASCEKLLFSNINIISLRL